MRSAWRTLDSATLRAVAVMCASILVIGVSYGVTAHGAGLAWWQIVLIAAVVLAGASEFVFVGILAAGGTPIVGALAGLLVNTRNFGYGLAIGKHFRGAREIVPGAHLINDETVAMTTAETDQHRARASFLVCGLGIAICWPAGAAVGAILGGTLARPETLGLDAAFPALLAALAIPSLRSGSTWAAVLCGSAIAIATTPFLPAGLPIVGALGGLAAVEAVRVLRRPPTTADSTDPVGTDSTDPVGTDSTSRDTEEEMTVRSGGVR